MENTLFTDVHDFNNSKKKSSILLDKISSIVEI